GLFGTNVIAECERILARATFEPYEPQQKAPPLAPPKDPTVLVAGGSGFIGRHLVRALAARGIGVRVVTRDVGSAQLSLAGLPAELMQGDLADRAFIDRALEGIDVVYDLAKSGGQDHYERDIV